ncbi:uncharacterized protein LOC127355326 [Dicentrarchus labrax]|uniref:ribonuclease H n=1 Tax=Dicentrarchus labrax TaxID=13489 RepID=A0A8P4KS28_DICLA|nr:uncharacterized protein LOC127355326 [Dicentrarchus labrax]
MQKTPLTGTYVKYSTEPFLRMPKTVLTIKGKQMTFLVDSGATYSVIQEKYLTNVKMSGNFVHSQGATGAIVKEKFTVPLQCSNTIDGDTVSTKHGFLLSPHCPINLMGRDLMLTLNISLESTPDGLKVVRRHHALSMVQHSAKTPLYVYQWRIPHPLATDLVRQARELVSRHADFMRAESLHCTAYVSEGPDHDFEKHFYQDLNDVLCTSTLFWSGTRSAVSVSLTEGQMKDFHVEFSSPHISLSKATTDEWKGLGPFVKKCLNITDWCPTRDPSVMYSACFNIYKKPFHCTTNALRSVYLLSVPRSHCSQSFVSCPTDVSPALASLPDTLWAQGKYDVGLIKNCAPVKITPKSTFRPCKQQYPLKKEAIEGITPVFKSLLQAGVIIPCPDSPVRTPIFPVKKIRDRGQPTEWRFVQDLKAVNDAVIPHAPIVPNPYTLLAQIPSGAKWFSVVDLSNALFSVPVHPDSQFWFAFNFEGKAYTFTRLCQGYCESPSLYNQALSASLDPLVLTPGTALLQYVDDLLIAAPTQEQCERDTLKLLRHLATEGHKVSLSKLQYVKQAVTFLGYDISGKGKTLSPKRIEAIRTLPKPVTKKQVMSFLGTCSYCRTFIPNFALLEAPLGALYHGKNLSSSDHVTWTPEAYQAFLTLKEELQRAPTLGLPDPVKPFTQAVDERAGCMTSVLMQPHGDRLRPIAYFSAKLDPVAAGFPRCLRAVAACEKALMASRDIVGYSDVTLLVPHAVSLILLEQKTSHLSTARWLSYHTVSLDMPNVTVKHEEHDCLAELQIQCTPRVDLSDVPLQNADLVLYVDGSASRNPVSGNNCVGFSVVSDNATLRSGPLPRHLSAQAAELIALTEACKLGEGKSVTIYTDSRYAFGVVHDFGALWRHRKFLTSSGKHIAHHNLISDLLSAIMLPTRLAVCKCAAHTGHQDIVSLGNARADAAAKTAAAVSLPHTHSHIPVHPPHTHT